MTAALDRAVANALGLKSVNNCEQWSKTMDETQPAQEPKFWEMPDGKIVNKWGLQFYNGVVGAALYTTTPPPRPWVGLTNEEIEAIYLQHHNQYCECESPNWGYERAIEQALKEKNT